jgi:hypothetical protein
LLSGAGISDGASLDMMFPSHVVTGARLKTKVFNPMVSFKSVATSEAGGPCASSERLPYTEDSGARDKGIPQFNINSLRDMPHIRNKAKKEL